MVGPEYIGEKSITNETLQARKFELNQTPEGRKVRERIEIEYDRRTAILRGVVNALGIPEDRIILRPIVLDRVDFGYCGDIDLVFLGSEEEKGVLLHKLHKSFGLFPFIVVFDEARLKEIQEAMPELYNLLMSKKGRIPRRQIEIHGDNFKDEEAELEMLARRVLSSEEKEALKKWRLEIAENFVEDVKKKVPVAAYAFSGSMINDMERFSINSDLDIDLITNPEDEENADDWIHLYLEWKYAEEYGIKVDVADDTLGFAKEMVLLLPKLAEYYKRTFNLDLLEEERE